MDSCHYFCKSVGGSVELSDRRRNQMALNVLLREKNAYETELPANDTEPQYEEHFQMYDGRWVLPCLRADPHSVRHG